MGESKPKSVCPSACPLWHDLTLLKRCATVPRVSIVCLLLVRSGCAVWGRFGPCRTRHPMMCERAENPVRGLQDRRFASPLAGSAGHALQLPFQSIARRSPQLFCPCACLSPAGSQIVLPTRFLGERLLLLWHLRRMPYMSDHPILACCKIGT